MKFFSKNNQSNSSFKHWFKLIAITGSAQVAVQALGFVCGILMIRLLPVQEYAWYVLANTMLGAMTVLADGGISQGVMSEGGKVWQDKDKLGVVLATGLDLRRKFAIVILIISLPILLFLLIDNEASWLTSIMIALSLIPAFYASLSDTLLQIVPKLHQNIGALQRNQLVVGIGRLLLIFGTLFLFPFTYVAIIANGIPRVYGNFRLYKIAAEHSNKGKPDSQVRANILEIVKRILPGSIYFAISGQLLIWIISIFGETESIAQVGGLMRYGILFSLLSTIIATIFIPDFSKLPNSKKILRKHYFRYLFGLIFLVIIIVGLVYLFSTPLLWVLGDAYANLKYELLLLIIASGLSFISGSMFNFGSAKGWPSSPVFLIPVNISFVIIGVVVFNMNILTEVLFFNIFRAIPPTIVHVMNFMNKTKNI